MKKRLFIFLLLLGTLDPLFAQAQKPQATAGLKKIIQQMKSGQEVKILCYGNSITFGQRVDISTGRQTPFPYPKTLLHFLQNRYNNKKIQIINEGHSGWRTDRALRSFDQLVLSKKPDLVTIMFGINDAYSGFSNAFYQKKIQGMVQRLKKQGIEVWLLSPTPILTKYDAKVQEYVSVLKQIAQEESIAFTNMHDAINHRIKHSQIPAQEILPDDVHFADKYYPWIAKEMIKYIDTLGLAK